MKRGSRVISLAITLSMVLSLVLPGQSAWAEQQLSTVEEVEEALVETNEIATLESTDDEVVDSPVVDETPEVEEAPVEDALDVELDSIAIESEGDEPEGDGSGLQNVDDGVKSELAFGWGVERIIVPDTSVRVGEEFEVKAVITGSYSDLTYVFSWKRQGGGGAGTLTGSISSSKRSCTFSESGLYTLTVTATDAKGHSCSASKDVNIYQLESATLELTGSCYMLKPDMGCNEQYCYDTQYRYSWKYGSTSGVLKDWSGDEWCCFSATDVPVKNNAITLVIEARDDNGSLGQVTTSYKSWKLDKLALPSTSARRGSTVTSEAMVYGNTEGLSYLFTWNLNGSSSSQNNGVTTGSSSSNTRSCMFGSTGTFNLTTKVTDELGRSETASKKVYVYALLKANLTKNGDTFMLKPDMGCSVNYLSGVEYRYTWKETGTSKSGVLKNWSDEAWCSFNYSKFKTAAHTIQVTIEARDANGSLGTKSATFSANAMDAKAQGYSSPTNYLIMVNNNTCWIGVYRGSRGNWERIKTIRCSTGAYHNTPDGVFSIGARGYSFSGADYTCYWYTDYYLGLYAFHSVLYRLGTHTVKDGRLGMHISAGCIRLHIDDAKWIYDNMPYGTTVVIYWG